MITALVAFAVVATLAAVFVLARTYWQNRGARLITCPDNNASAAVEIDARGAVLRTAAGRSTLSLQSCSRWPEKKDCGQECLAQIESSDDGCRATAIVSRWYEGKSCVYCGRAIPAHWHDRRPALMSPDFLTVQWSDIPIDELPAVLETHQPVCWNCHIAESFRKNHAGLVIDRPWPKEDVQSRDASASR
jgi:hypothetical protein